MRRGERASFRPGAAPRGAPAGKLRGCERGIGAWGEGSPGDTSPAWPGSRRPPRQYDRSGLAAPTASRPVNTAPCAAGRVSRMAVAVPEMPISHRYLATRMYADDPGTRTTVTGLLRVT